ncbi:polygalacturonase [Quercus robur]|uniref:polygalacturonase n=1 Tax=Quercus robur TaxID=38942 RepID=UPI0021632FF0|nr:polygalacturonase [Quercus robur]
MSQQSQFLALFIILASFSTCFSTYKEDPHATNGGPDPIAHTTSMGTINQGDKHEPWLVDFMKSQTKRFGLTTRLSSASTSQKLVNVDDFGAKANGGDDTEAFRKAWKVACSSANSALVVTANKNYHLKPITFSGPCKPYFTMKVYGTIKASSHKSDYEKDTLHWLVFENLQDFNIEGGGTINGNGRIWWESSCKINDKLPCKHAPTAVTFQDSKNVRVSSIRIKNAQQMHLTFQNCQNVEALNLVVVAPGNSPNTDGIHVTGTQNIQIQNCVIRTGDDCISIVSGSKNVQATDITCGPGHGISIGSLGADNSEAEVSNVMVNRAKLTGTTNGMRIKTWQGGSGYAKNIMFQNVVMNNVSNPIIIDQNYCDQKTPCQQQPSAVKISNVAFKNIKGTSASEEAIKFDCSKSFPCQGVLLQDVNLVRQGNGDVDATCLKVGLQKKGNVSPGC